MIDESKDPPGEMRRCDCGGLTRNSNAHAVDTNTPRDGASFKHKRPGFKKPIAEGFIKPDTSRKTGEAVERQMLVDRQNDRYFELVTEYRTSEVLHHCDEKLSEHIGHGDAKKKNPQDVG